MGIFSSLFGQAKELTKLSTAVANIKTMLDKYEYDPDVTYLLVSAWICKAGVIDMINKNKWPPNYCVYVPINGHQTKMSMMEVQLSTITRLMNKVVSLNDKKLEEGIQDVLNGGKSFYELDAQMPQDIKSIL